MQLNIDITKEAIQEIAFQKWIDNQKIGTIECITGIGKTFISFRAMLSMPKGSNCLFLAETTVN